MLEYILYIKKGKQTKVNKAIVPVLSYVMCMYIGAVYKYKVFPSAVLRVWYMYKSYFVRAVRWCGKVSLKVLKKDSYTFIAGSCYILFMLHFHINVFDLVLCVNDSWTILYYIMSIWVEGFFTIFLPKN